jgi:hypothetical protein
MLTVLPPALLFISGNRRWKDLPAAVMAETSGGLAFVVGFDQRREIGAHVDTPRRKAAR